MFLTNYKLLMTTNVQRVDIGLEELQVTNLRLMSSWPNYKYVFLNYSSGLMILLAPKNNTSASLCLQLFSRQYIIITTKNQLFAVHKFLAAFKKFNIDILWHLLLIDLLEGFQRNVQCFLCYEGFSSVFAITCKLTTFCFV